MRYAVRCNEVPLWLTGTTGTAGMTLPAPLGNRNSSPGGMTGTIDKTARACLAEVQMTHVTPIMEDQT